MALQPDSEFLNFLKEKSLRNEYSREIQNLNRKIEADFKRNKEHHKSNKKMEIETDKRHRELLSACTYPFHTKGTLSKTGYRLLRFDPLSELEEPNFDFLLFKYNQTHSIAVFGECKGSISDPHEVIVQSLERQKAVEANMSYIKEKYFSLKDSQDVQIEYVLAVSEVDHWSMLKGLMEENEKFIVWWAPLTSKPYLTCSFPPSSIPNKENFMHKDHILRKELANKPKSNRVGFSYFRQSHKFSKLSPLIFASNPNGTHFVIERANLANYLHKDLFFENDEVIDKEADSIIALGLKIGFLKQGDAEGQYLLTSRVKSTTRVEKALLNKWLEYQLQLDLSLAKDNGKNMIQEKYMMLKQKRPSLETFRP